MRHRRTPRCRLWQEQSDWSVSRGSVLASLAQFFLLFCHETPPIRPSIAHLRPFGGPRPPPHYVFCCYFYSCGKFKVLSVTGTLKKSRVRFRERSERRRGEGDVKPDLSTTMLLHSLFTCCTLWLASHTQDGCTETSQPLSPPPQPLSTPNVVCHCIYHFLLLLLRGKKGAE